MPVGGPRYRNNRSLRVLLEWIHENFQELKNECPDIYCSIALRHGCFSVLFFKCFKLDAGLQAITQTLQVVSAYDLLVFGSIKLESFR